MQAANPLPSDIKDSTEALLGKVRTAAVCVYPSRVKDAYEAIKQMNLTKEINIAAGDKKIFLCDKGGQWADVPWL